MNNKTLLQIIQNNLTSRERIVSETLAKYQEAQAALTATTYLADRIKEEIAKEEKAEQVLKDNR